SLARIRRAVRYLVETDEDVASLALVTDGDAVWACRDERQILDALRHGRLALFLGVDRITADLESEIQAFDAERQEFVNGLRAGAAAPARRARAASAPVGAERRPHRGGRGPLPTRR